MSVDHVLNLLCDIPCALSFPLIFSVRVIVSHCIFGFDFKGRGTMLFPLNGFFFFLITKFI